MGFNVLNLTAGPGDLYFGAVGATEPATVTTAPVGPAWTDVGGTLDGVTVAFNQEYMTLLVDQAVENAGRRITSREATIATNLAEPTLENLALALNSGEVASSASAKTLTFANDTSATQPLYKALIFDGWAPGLKADGSSPRRRVHGRRCLSVESPEMAYSKDGQTVLTVSFATHAVGGGVASVEFEDEIPA